MRARITGRELRSSRGSNRPARRDVEIEITCTLQVYMFALLPHIEPSLGDVMPFPDPENTEGLGVGEKSRLEYDHTRQLTVTSSEQR